MIDYIYEQFKERVKDFGLTVGPEDQDGNIEIDYGNMQLVINLTNARKDYQQHGSLELLDKLIASLHESLMGKVLPSWDEAASHIYAMLVRESDVRDEGCIVDPIAEAVVRIYVYHRKGIYTWISHHALEIWGISLDDFKARCNYNMDILLDECELLVMRGPDGKKFIGFNSAISWLNTALFFTKGFKRKVEKAIGWPVYFAMPTREFGYFVNIKDRSSIDLLIPMFTDILDHEELHLSREIFSMTDLGLTVVGRY